MSSDLAILGSLGFVLLSRPCRGLGHDPLQIALDPRLQRLPALGGGRRARAPGWLGAERPEQGELPFDLLAGLRGSL